jgi:hypothetical protein
MKLVRLTFMVLSLGYIISGLASCGAPENEIVLGPEAVTKKLIDFNAQPLPTPKVLRADASIMKTRGYAGAIATLSNSYMEVFVAGDDPERLHEFSDFNTDYNELRALKTQGLMTDNFLRINSAREASWNWFDDADWTLTEKNLRIFSRAASIGGFKGIAFDPEAYGLSPWYYQASTYPGKSFQTVYNKVKARGKRFISVIQSELPNARILSLYLTQPIIGQWEKYELWKPFFEGMLEGATSGVRFIDGNEPSYYYLSASDFDKGKTTIQQGYTSLAPSLTTKFKQQVRVAQSAYVDGVLNLYNSPRFFGFYLASDTERRQLFQHNLYHGLRSTDEYVWVYGETVNLYRNTRPSNVPFGFLWSVKSVTSKIAAGQPLGFNITSFINRARLEYDRKVGVYGTVNTSADPTINVSSDVQVSSGFVDSKGNESACIIYNAYGNFECIFPYGWTGNITPKATGKTFAPTQRSYSNLQQGVGEQDFTMR